MADGFGTWDWVTLGCYFLVVILIGVLSTVLRKDRGSSSGFFLGGRSMHWIPIGASTFASNIGAPTIMGIAGSAAATGIAITIYEWHALFMLIALGWVFLPVYIASNSFTMPEYLMKRFGGMRLRIFFAGLTLFIILLNNIPMEMYSGGLFIQQVVPSLNIYLAVAILLVVTALYSVIGGLGAVIITDTLQTFVIIGGTIGIAVICLVDERIGGFNGLYDQYLTAVSNSTITLGLQCGYPPETSLHMMRPASDPSYPWTGLVFGLTIMAGYNWCNNQVIVQRALAAKNMTHAKAGVLFAGYLKILPFFLFVIPGMAARVLLPESIACSTPDECLAICDNKAGCSNLAYPKLLLEGLNLPAGIRGLMMAAFMAALMSSLTANFNSAGSIFTMDIYRRVKPNTSDRELVVVGRIFILVMIVLSMAWLPIFQLIQGATLWDYMQTIVACMTPPIFAVFCMGVFWKRTTERGAFWGLMFSTGIGFVRLILDFVYPVPPCGEFLEDGTLKPDNRPAIVKDVAFLNFAALLFAISVVSIAVLSLLTEPAHEKRLARVTYWTRSATVAPVIIEEIMQDLAEEKAAEVRRKEAELQGELTGKQKFYNRLCGFSNLAEQQASPAEVRAAKEAAADITEQVNWRNFMNFQAIVGAAIVLFLWIWWA